MRLAQATTGGHGQARRKLGNGTWPLDACPIDGGAIAFDERGNAVSTWRRDQRVYLAPPIGRKRNRPRGQPHDDRARLPGHSSRGTALTD